MADRPGALVDQGARDLAREALARVDRLEAVYEEAEKHRAMQLSEMDRKLSGWMERIQASNNSNWADLSQRHSTAINTLADNWSDRVRETDGALKTLDGKFWKLLWAYAAGMTAIAGLLAANKIGL